MALKLHSNPLRGEAPGAAASGGDTTMMQSTDTPPARSASTVHKWRHLAMQGEVIVLLAMVLFNLIFTRTSGRCRPST
ncbi:hypothetical protein HDG35_003183 [Paraburkholderia sp. JPY681]|nr:hypothetical protein [Paraburkholderia atlantica]MBB5506914.1 hypothetical protein [Paraburkholderia atlantica]